MKRNYELASLVLRRVLGALPVLLIVSLITFGMMRLIPGDPSSIIGGLSATPAPLAQIRSDLGLDEPFTVQLLRWYGGLLHGNLGRAIKPQTAADHTSHVHLLQISRKNRVTPMRSA